MNAIIQKYLSKVRFTDLTEEGYNFYILFDRYGGMPSDKKVRNSHNYKDVVSFIIDTLNDLHDCVTKFKIEINPDEESYYVRGYIDINKFNKLINK